MSGAIEIILIFLILANLILLGASRLRNVIRIVALQGLVLGLLPLLAHRDGLVWPAVLLGAGVDHPPLHAENYDFPDALIAPSVRLFHQVARDLTG